MKKEELLFEIRKSLIRKGYRGDLLKAQESVFEIYETSSKTLLESAKGVGSTGINDSDVDEAVDSFLGENK